jgi:hypothetical protein
MSESRFIIISFFHITLLSNISRHEMIKTTLLMMSMCIETVLSHSYISITSLLMFGTMWSMDMRFDTRLFTISYVILTYTHQSSVHYFNFAIRDLLNYMAAEKRIRVRLNRCLIVILIENLSVGISFTW